MKRVLLVLLPDDARESILGDLEERGFRFLDCASAILAARWAALRREWWGPVPNLAGASEEAIARRIAQLDRARRAKLPFAAGLMTVLVVRLFDWGAPVHWAWLVGPISLVALMQLLWGIPRGLSVKPLEPLAAHYRAHLRLAEMQAPALFGYILALQNLLPPALQQRPHRYDGPWILAAAFIAWHRWRRVRREQVSARLFGSA